MEQKNIFVDLCRKLFFKTGEIGYYLLANEVERVESFEETEETLTL